MGKKSALRYRIVIVIPGHSPGQVLTHSLKDAKEFQAMWPGLLTMVIDVRTNKVVVPLPMSLADLHDILAAS